MEAIYIKTDNGKISQRQFQILLILYLFGAGFLAPRRAAGYAGEDAWLAMLAAAVVAVVLVFIITSLGRMFPGVSFMEYSGRILTRPVAVIINLLFAVKIIAGTAMELRLFGEIIKETMLNYTPFWAVAAAMLSVSGFMAAKGYEARARVGELLIVIVFVPMIIMFALAAKDADFTNLLPAFKTPPQDLMKGALSCIPAFTGIELCLIVPHYLPDCVNFRRRSVSAVAMTGIFFAAAAALSVAALGANETARQIWPVLRTMEAVNLPGSVIERQTALCMTFWIISSFAVTSAGLFFSAVIAQDCIGAGTREPRSGKGRLSVYVTVIGAAIFAVSLLPGSITRVFEATDAIFAGFGIFYMAILPLFMLAVAKLRGYGSR